MGYPRIPAQDSKELKRSYEREDQLIDALNIIKQDLESGEDVQKIINFAKTTLLFDRVVLENYE